MRNLKRTLTLALVLVGTLAAAPALYAEDSRGSHGPMMDRGMMGGHGMGMMNRMRQMMDQCGAMMQGNSRGHHPNGLRRQQTPARPDKDG